MPLDFQDDRSYDLAVSKPNNREQIFDAALQLLGEKGFNACSVQDITAAAGVPKGSFYNHFESKEVLGAEIIAHYGARPGVRAVLADESIEPLQRLSRYFAALNELASQQGFQKGCMLANFSAELSDQSPLIRGQLATVYQQWSGKIETVIAQGQAQGSINKDLSAAMLAEFLLNAWEGARLRAKVERNDSALKTFTDVIFQKILS